jgi:hypothetical protein
MEQSKILNEGPGKVLALPQKSGTMVVACLVVQGVAVFSLAEQPGGNVWLLLVAFLLSGLVVDLVSGMAHFSFDYLWEPATPILGPLAVEFQQHHVEPTLDPADLVENLSKGAYVGLPVALAACWVSRSSSGAAVSFLLASVLTEGSIWILGFHQIHSYAHMGAQLSPTEFNHAVAKFARLSFKQRKVAFAELFSGTAIPPIVRLFQCCHIFIRPEVHWQHHICFEQDFASVNGWSDWMMNRLYRKYARRSKELGQTGLRMAGSR